MADNSKTIDQLPEKKSLVAGDMLPVDDGAQTYRILWSTILAAVPGVVSIEKEVQQGKETGAFLVRMRDGSSIRIKLSDPDKQDRLTFDAEPVAGSGNVVSSGTIYSIVQAINEALAGKVDSQEGMGLSERSFTAQEKEKLSKIDDGATKTEIANNLTTTTAGSALDASQGKVLADLISAVTADTSVHQASGTSLSLQTGKGGMRWQDDAIVGMTHKSPNLINIDIDMLNASKSGDYWVGKYDPAMASRIGFKNPSFKASTQYTVYFEGHGDGGTPRIRVSYADGTSNDTANIGSTDAVITMNTTAGKTVSQIFVTYGTKGDTGNLYIKKLMVAEGASVNYEPYGIHSTGDMGVFDGKLIAGYMNASTGEVISSTAIVSLENKIPCNAGDSIHIDIPSAYQTRYFFWDKDDKPIGSRSGFVYDYTAPANANSFRCDISVASGSVTVENAPAISITINGQYAIVVAECGKNLAKFHPGRIQASTGIIVTNDFTHLISDYIPIDFDNHNYVLRLYGATVNNFVAFYDKNFTPIGRTGAGTGGRLLTKQTSLNPLYSTLTIADAKYMIVDYYSVDDGAEIMVVEEGMSLDSYTPYQGKTYTIPIPHPARGIGDVKETVHKVGQQWVMDKIIGVVDGGDLSYGLTTDYGARAFFRTIAIKDRIFDVNTMIMCDGFNSIPYTTLSVFGNTASDGDCAAQSTNVGLLFMKSDISDPTEFRSYMTGKKIYYVMDTPTTEPLPDQSAMYEMESYAEHTYIDTADGLAEMAVEYGQSDLMATALDGQRIAMRNQALIESK